MAVSRLASEHLSIFMINCNDFLPLLEMDVRFALCSLIHLTYDPFKTSLYGSPSLVVALCLAEGQVKTCFPISHPYMA